MSVKSMLYIKIHLQRVVIFKIGRHVVIAGLMIVVFANLENRRA